VHSADIKSRDSSRDPAGGELADVVSRLRRAMRRAARAADPAPTLSVAQLELLSCLAEHDRARPGQLARLLRLAPSSVATLVNGLRTEGLVTRDAGDDDRRTASLRLTPAGSVAVESWKSLNEDLLHAALGSLPAASGRALRAALPALRELAGAVDALADENKQRKLHPQP
jgi:DNA-binding MarR family transcriptional regulator